MRRSIMSDKGRPTEFKTTPGSDLILIVFHLQAKDTDGGGKRVFSNLLLDTAPMSNAEEE